MRTWPHAPSRLVKGLGTYMVTGATLHKDQLFDTPQKLDLLHDTLLDFADRYGWTLQAWAAFANHYHFVGAAPQGEDPVGKFTAALHRRTARNLNGLDGLSGRQVWYRSWATRLTYERSHLARLAYVVWNPAKHGLVADPARYPWCSMNWFRSLDDGPFVESVLSFDTSKVRVRDDY